MSERGVMTVVEQQTFASKYALRQLVSLCEDCQRGKDKMYELGYALTASTRI